VKIEYDPDKTSEDALKKLLDDSGYLGELDVPLETGRPAVGGGGETYFRHSAAHECAGTALCFGQEIAGSGRPLWPCPGMCPAPTMDE
jgi:hypothetical protein